MACILFVLHFRNTVDNYFFIEFWNLFLFLITTSVPWKNIITLLYHTLNMSLDTERKKKRKKKSVRTHFQKLSISIHWFPEATMKHTLLCFLKIKFHRTNILFSILNNSIRFEDQFVTKFFTLLKSHASKFNIS